MEDKENLVDWIDNQFVEHAKRLGLKLQMMIILRIAIKKMRQFLGQLPF